MTRRTTIARLSLLPLMLLAGTACSAQPRGALARCPATLPAASALPKGARLLGAASAGAPLSSATAVDQAPGAVRADGRFLAEIEPEPGTGGVYMTSWVDSTSNPVSLVCRYGPGLVPGRASAMLLVPIPARATGECALTKGAGRPTAMTCVARKP